MKLARMLPARPTFRGERLDTPGEVGQVEEEIGQEDVAAPAHRATGVVGDQVLAGSLIVDRAGPAVHEREGGGGMDVEGEGQDQARPA